MQWSWCRVGGHLKSADELIEAKHVCDFDIPRHSTKVLFLPHTTNHIFLPNGPCCLRVMTPWV